MLSQSVGYAATALGYIAAAGGKPVLVKDVAEACAIPGPYLAKIIHALARCGVVATQRGVGGGVTLAHDPESVTLLDLCEALGDPVVQRRCLLGPAPCSDERACPAHAFWAGYRERLLEFLRRTTISDIAEFESHRRWTAQALPASGDVADAG
jgi:Rrf2 family protein